VRIDGARIQQLAGGVHHGQLGTGAEAGIKPQHGLSCQGRLPQQCFEVGGKDFDGVRFRRHGQFATHVTFDGGQQQAFGRVKDGRLQFLAEGRTQVRAEIVDDGTLPVLLLHAHLHAQHLFRLAAVDGQHLVRTHAADLRGELVIGFIDGLFVLGVLNEFTGQRAELHGLAAGFSPHLGGIADRLGGDVARAGQGVFDGLDLFVQEALGHLLRVSGRARLREDHVGQALQPFFTGHRGARAALGFVGRVEVLDGGHGVGGMELLE